MAPISKRAPKKDSKKVQGQTLRIIVGSAKETFSAHTSLISDSSSLFRKAMSGPWKESSRRTVELPEDDPKIFTLYLHWIYFGNIPVICEAADEKDGVKRLNEECRGLVEAYVLGDKLLDTKFQNFVIDAIIEQFSTADKSSGHPVLPGTQVTDRVFAGTLESSKLRSLFVDLYTERVDADWITEHLHADNFVTSVVKALCDKRKSLYGSSAYINPSKYHV